MEIIPLRIYILSFNHAFNSSTFLFYTQIISSRILLFERKVKKRNNNNNNNFTFHRRELTIEKMDQEFNTWGENL